MIITDEDVRVIGVFMKVGFDHIEELETAGEEMGVPAEWCGPFFVRLHTRMDELKQCRNPTN